MKDRIACLAGIAMLIVVAVRPAEAQFNYPECAVFHEGSDRYFISNEGNGTIVAISGSWDTTMYAMGYPTAVGMVVVRDTLYVSCSPLGIVGFDLVTDMHVTTIPVPGSVRLNDLCFDSSGYLWATDPQGSQVFRVDLGDGSSVLVNSSLYMVNGIHYDVRHDRILVNQWVPSSWIRAIDPHTYALSNVVATGQSNLNGLTEDHRGNIYFTSWGISAPYLNGAIYKYDSAFSGPPVLVSSGHHGGGDMCYNTANAMIVIPNVWGHSVDFFVDPFADTDNDSIISPLDNCPDDYNPEQDDDDIDGVGDACDNCPDTYNPDQIDINGNDIGDACDCICDCHADPQCDGVTDVLDVVQAVNVAFRSAPDIPDPNALCPRVTTDADCDGVTNVLDVVRFVNVSFRSADPWGQFCDPCPP